MPAVISLRFRRALLLALASVLLCVSQTATATAQTPPDPAAAASTPDHPSYEVSLRSDTDGSRWTGRQTMSFRNSARTPLRSVDVRVWGNGADGCGTPEVPSPTDLKHAVGSVDEFGKRFGRYAYGELDLVMSDNLDEFGNMEFPARGPGGNDPGPHPFWTEHRIH